MIPKEKIICVQRKKRNFSYQIAHLKFYIKGRTSREWNVSAHEFEGEKVKS